MNRIEKCKLEGAAAALAKEYSLRMGDLRNAIKTGSGDISSHSDTELMINERMIDLGKIYAAWNEVVDRLEVETPKVNGVLHA